jgi:hypothetical protein
VDRAEHVPAHHAGPEVLARFLDYTSGSTTGSFRWPPGAIPTPPSPSGFSSLWFGPATKPSSEIEI